MTKNNDSENKNMKEFSISVNSDKLLKISNVDSDKLLKISKKSLEICSMICVFITISILLLKIKNVFKGHAKLSFAVIFALAQSILIGFFAAFMQYRHTEVELQYIIILTQILMFGIMYTLVMSFQDLIIIWSKELNLKKLKMLGC